MSSASKDANKKEGGAKIPGTKVRFKGEEGVSLGPVFNYGVWWILVEWSSGRKAVVLEHFLELI